LCVVCQGWWLGVFVHAKALLTLLLLLLLVVVVLVLLLLLLQVWGCCGAAQHCSAGRLVPLSDTATD
jgi:hypothetical protein